MEAIEEGTGRHYGTLNAVVAAYALKGWTISSVTPGQAIVQRKKPFRILLNLALVFFTFGLWWLVIIVRLVNRRIETKVITVDAFGVLRETS